MRITRREFLKRSAQVGVAAAAGLSALEAAAQEEKRLVVYNFDGLLGDIIKQEWIAPFEKETGVKVDTIVTPGSSPPMSKLKQQIDTGTLDADVTFLQQTDYVFAVRNNMLLPLPGAAPPDSAARRPSGRSACPRSWRTRRHLRTALRRLCFGQPGRESSSQARR